MPILRMPADNTMAETLGNLGSQLAQNLSPKTAAEAQLLMRQIWLRNLELYKQQRELQAQDQAVKAYGPLVGNDPNALAQIRAGIIGGMNQKDVLELAIRLAPDQWDHSGTPEAAQHNMARVTMLTGQPWKEAYPPVVDMASLKVKNDMEAQQAGAKAGQEALGKGSAEQALRTYPWEDNPGDPASRNRDAAAYFRITGNKMPDDFLANTAAFNRTVATSMDEATAAAKARGERIGAGGIDKPVTAVPPPQIPTAPDVYAKTVQPQPPGGRGPQPPAGGPQPPAGGGPQPDVYAPPVAGTERYFLPRPIRVTVGGITQNLENPEDAKFRMDENVRRQGELEGSYDDMGRNAELLANIDKITELANHLDNQGLLQQVPLALANWFKEKSGGINVTDAGTTAQAMQQMLQTQIMDVLKQMKVQRTAGPELSGAQKIIGQPDWDPRVLKSALATEKVQAQQALDRGNAAGTVLQRIPDDPNQPGFDYAAFQKLKQDQQKAYGAAVQAQRDQMGAIGATPPTPPAQTVQPPTQPVVPENMVLDPATRKLVPAPAPPVTPPPVTPPPVTPPAPPPG